MNITQEFKEKFKANSSFKIRLKMGICSLLMLSLLVPIVLGFTIEKASIGGKFLFAVTETLGNQVKERSQAGFEWQKDSISAARVELAHRKVEQSEVENKPQVNSTQVKGAVVADEPQVTKRKPRVRKPRAKKVENEETSAKPAVVASATNIRA